MLGWLLQANCCAPGFCFFPDLCPSAITGLRNIIMVFRVRVLRFWIPDLGLHSVTCASAASCLEKLRDCCALAAKLSLL